MLGSLAFPHKRGSPNGGATTDERQTNARSTSRRKTSQNLSRRSHLKANKGAGSSGTWRVCGELAGVAPAPLADEPLLEPESLRAS
jgi:hypothetical protein